MRSRPTFLAWLLITSVAASLLAAGASMWLDELASLGGTYRIAYVVLAVWAIAQAYVGVLAWRCDEYARGFIPTYASLRRGLDHVWQAVAALPYLGLLGSVAGFVVAVVSGFGGGADTSPEGLAHTAGSVANGAAAAMLSTFVGVGGSLVLWASAHLVASRAGE
jgi:hypothetical protein